MHYEPCEGERQRRLEGVESQIWIAAGRGWFGAQCERAACRPFLVSTPQPLIDFEHKSCVWIDRAELALAMEH